jgi:hypothetical protein
MIRNLVLLLWVCLFTPDLLKAQTSSVCFSDNFNNNSATTGWVFSSGAGVNSYQNPLNGCQSDYGIVTPGVGGNNPAKLTTPFMISNGSTFLVIGFDIFRLNSNLNCNTWSNFACPTSIDVSVIKGSSVFGVVSDLMLPENGPGSIPTLSLVFNAQNQLAAGDSFKVQIDFKPRSGTGNCIQNGTKYVIDNFKVCQPVDVTVNFLNAQDDSLCSLANGTETFSNDLSTNDNRSEGLNLVYSLANGPFGNGNTVPGGADLVINANGTFTITRTDPARSVFDFTYRVTDPVNGLSDLATCTVCFNSGGALPLELISIGAVRKKQMVTVSWKTSSESNLSSFEIQRKVNGQFETIGTVIPQNKPNGSAYTFTETNVYKAISEYRIKSIEAGGTQKFSQIRSVKGFGEDNNLLVFPNPSNGSATVLLNDCNGSISVDILDNAGRLIKSVKSVNENKVHINGLKPGVYMIRATELNTGNSAIQKLVVED